MRRFDSRTKGRRWLSSALALAMAVAALATSCFEPDFGDCEIACALEDNACPRDYHCSEGFCTQHAACPASLAGRAGTAGVPDDESNRVGGIGGMPDSAGSAPQDLGDAGSLNSKGGTNGLAGDSSALAGSGATGELGGANVAGGAGPGGAAHGGMAGGAGTGTATGTPSSANGINGNGTGDSACYDAAWAKAVSDHIGRHLRYPEHAARDHITGVVFVHFIVRRNGLLDKLEIGKSSGDTTLDDAAYDLVRQAQPLPRIPDRMHAERVDTELPIAYGIKGAAFHATQGSCGG